MMVDQVALKLSLRTAFKNFRRDRPDEDDEAARYRSTTDSGGPPSKRLRVFCTSDSVQLTGEEYEDAVTELKRMYKGEKKKRNYARIKVLMESTQHQRRKWIVEESPRVAEILDKFPFLSSNKTLRREFRTIAEIDGRAAEFMTSWPDWAK